MNIPGTPITDAEVIRIGELYRAGLGARRIGWELGRSEHSVRNVLGGKRRRYRMLLGGRLMNGKRPQKGNVG